MKIDEFLTLPELLALRVESSANDVGFWELNSRDQWEPVTWLAFSEQVTQTAARLAARGVRPGDRVGLLFSNGLNWEILHQAILRLGAVVVGLDRNDPVDRLHAIFESARPTALFVEQAQLASFLTQEAQAALVCKVSFSAKPEQDWESWTDFNTSVVDLKLLPAQPSPNQPATLIYTSGTTGAEKGILYTQAQMAMAARCISRNYGDLGEGKKLICWLPLSALFQRMANLYAMLMGAQTYFLADPRRIMEVLPTVSPDFFISVPRFYEKVLAGIESKVKHSPWPLKMLYYSALGISGARARRIREGKNVGILLKILQPMTDRMVLSKVRAIMGKRLSYMVSGSAAIPIHLLEYYHALGWVILEAYGFSENIIPMAMNQPNSFRFGTVGKILPENDFRFDTESVLQVRGPGLFQGYYGDTTLKPFTDDGYYDTGDFGELIDGFLLLKGRRSELIKTSTGRRVAPVNVETALKTCSLIDQAVVFGSGHKQLIALITLNSEALTALGMSTLLDPPADKLKAVLKEGLLAAAHSLPAHERPAGYMILQHSLSIAAGEITSSLKLRRKNIAERYKFFMDSLFAQVDVQETKEVNLVFVSEAQMQQARFADVPTQTEVVSSKFKRMFLLLRIFLRVVEIKFWDVFPHLDLGAAWFEQRHKQSLRRIGNIISRELSYLKGPAAKLGQMASYLTDAVPLLIRHSLAKLQSGAVPLSSDQIIKIVEESLGHPLDVMFEQWDHLPLAVASMSQVHLARLKTGERVVVKVLYPDAQKIVSADIEILKAIFPLLGRAMGFTNGRELMIELLDLFEQECDFSKEAVNQQIFAKIFKDNPNVIIPKVYMKFTSKQVLTMEYVNGIAYDQFKEAATQQAKDDAAKIIFTVTSQSIARYGIFNADPHPGNYLFVGNKVCFLDFGFVRRWPKEFIDLWKQQSLAGASKDVEAFTKATEALGFKGVKDYQKLMNQFTDISYVPWKDDRVFGFTPDFIKAEVGKIFYYDNKVGPLHMPSEFTAISRLFAGQYAVFSDLQAKANWHRILMPMLLGPTFSLKDIELML
ncbi:MAG: AMP-binding protein [Candidatus Omnitrophica bacterium]|nr:AMP-binding protein [Candidatus Omnitrophota bacterium]